MVFGKITGRKADRTSTMWFKSRTPSADDKAVIFEVQAAGKTVRYRVDRSALAASASERPATSD